MRKRDFERLAVEEFNAFREIEPNKSENMHDATRLVFDGNTAIISIPADEVPYSIYTVISWADTSPVIINTPKRPDLKGKSSFLWKDGDTPNRMPKKNPNEGWIDRAVLAMAKSIARKLGGKIVWSF